MATNTIPGTRAVIRSIDAGSSSMCQSCTQQIKFTAKVKHYQVICNVYTDGRWNRVEHFHLECYQDLGNPHGDAA